MNTSVLKNKTRELEVFIKKANRKLLALKVLHPNLSVKSFPKLKEGSLTELSERSFDFWNNPVDVIYDNL